METIRVKSWDGFERTIAAIRREHGIYRREMQDGTVFQKETRILFRGQANAKWQLNTTLERQTADAYDVLRYVHAAAHHAYEVESFTGTRWNVPTFPEYEKEIAARKDPFEVYLPAYSYLVYLRHHAFPSPLLDWAESPYVAAYFAFAERERGRAAVYCYIERPKLIKSGSAGTPMITVKGPYVTTHKRHFAQKAWYTIATKWSYTEEKHYFCLHELVFDRNDEDQDLLIKIEIPTTQRSCVLKALNGYNINHFTLFQSEDSLIKALAMKEFDNERD
jgi:hypothetical protein